MKLVSNNTEANTSSIRATLRTENGDGTYSINGSGKFKRIYFGEQVIDDIDDETTWTPEFIEKNGLDKVTRIR